MSATSTLGPVAAVRACGRRLAAAAALAVALLSLVQHAPVWRACLDGAGTLLVLVLGTRLGSAALARAIACDRALVESRKKEARP